MTIEEYEKINETERKNQIELRQQFQKKIIEYKEIPALQKIKLEKVYFEKVEGAGYRMRPINKNETDRQEWQTIQAAFEEEASQEVLIGILKQLMDNNIVAEKKDSGQIYVSFDKNSNTQLKDNICLNCQPAQIVSYEEYKRQSQLQEERQNERTAANAEYFNECHNKVFYVQATTYLNRVGLYLYIDRLQIGYDKETSEIILPLYDLQYHSIKLKYDQAADKEAEALVVKHYNLKPKKAGECYLIRDETGKITGATYNNDKPYQSDSPYAELNTN